MVMFVLFGLLLLGCAIHGVWSANGNKIRTLGSAGGALTYRISKLLYTVLLGAKKLRWNSDAPKKAESVHGDDGGESRAVD